MEESFYTVHDLSEIYKIPESTIRGYIQKGKLQSQRIGRHHRISHEQWEQFLKDCQSHDAPS